MRDLDTLEHFQPSEDIVKVLMHKTQASDPAFFRNLVAYYFCKVASMMRVDIATHDRGIIPVNAYIINLQTSGFGKGFSTNIMEEEVIGEFRTRFLDSTINILAKKNLDKIAMKRAAKKNTVYEEERELVEKEYEALGTMPFSFDSGTSPAVKQVRHKALMASAGSLNLEMDEVANNLLGNVEVLTTYLELFDVGKVKQKLTKNTADNKRNEDIHGRTPTNMMLFGTPIKLLDGGKVEEEFDAMLGTGYARRCFFGYTKSDIKKTTYTPSEVYDMLTNVKDSTLLLKVSAAIGNLADITNFGQSISMTKDIAMLLIEYRLLCEEQANKLGDHEEVRKAEIVHRYFKALKVAGAYAFMSGSGEITEDLLYNAIRLTEDSGRAFKDLLTRERPFVKLAKYIASVDRDLTHVDLVEDLPFYKGSESAKRDLMNMAIAYGYTNNIIIKRAFIDDIEFLRGESLKETNLSEVTVAFSQDIAYKYINKVIAFDDLGKLSQKDGYHWINHSLSDGHRCDDSIVKGFNLLVIDVDGSTQISTVKLLLQEYKYHLYTTKSSTDKKNRFRIVFPMSHELKLTKEDYGMFMENVYEWLPFSVDTSTKDRCRKWLSHEGTVIDNDGKLFDVLPFIPKTSKNEERKKSIETLNSMSNLERWFIKRTGSGNRSNQFIKFAYLLVDMGKDEQDVKGRLVSLNDKLPNPLKLSEIESTIMNSVSKAIGRRDK